MVCSQVGSPVESRPSGNLRDVLQTPPGVKSFKPSQWTPGGGKGDNVCFSTPCRSLRTRGPNWSDIVRSMPNTPKTPLATSYCTPRCEQSLHDRPFKGNFRDVALVGSGRFASVYSCTNKIDYQTYAVKIFKPTFDKEVASRQVGALAVLSEKSKYIVRYFSSWFEDDCLHIQTELCKGTLRHRLQDRQRDSPESASFCQEELNTVLVEVSAGLAALHRMGWAHLEVRAESVLVGQENVYKLADAGLVVEAGQLCITAKEGDRRYVAPEFFQDEILDQRKSDIFSLGLLCYEVASNPKALPSNGKDWQRLREGDLNLTLVAQLSADSVDLLRQMVHVVPAKRPSCEDIRCHLSVSCLDEVQTLQKVLLQTQVAAAQVAAGSNFRLTVEQKR